MDIIGKIRSVFKREKQNLEPEEETGQTVMRLADARIYEIGGVWGNKIGWFRPEQFDGVPRESFDVVGWKPRKPRVGDVLRGNFSQGKREFIFTSVREPGSPPDMFFGTVVYVGFVNE